MNTLWFAIVVLLLVALQERLYQKYIFKNLSVTRGFDCSNALPGDIVQLSIKVTNRKILPVTWMHIESILPVELKLVNETVKEYRNKT